MNFLAVSVAVAEASIYLNASGVKSKPIVDLNVLLVKVDAYHAKAIVARKE